MRFLTTALERSERLWRQVGTGISFAAFGLGGVLLAAVVFPALNVFVSDPERRARVSQRAVHASWRFFVWLMKSMGVIEFETEGAELLQAERGALIIANHPSLIDVVLIMSLMDRTQCVVKPGVWRNPFMRGVVKATGYIPNLGEPERFIDDCVRALRAGNNLVIFPEGSRTVPGQTSQIQRGFANIAVRAMAPVRIVAMSCTPPTLLKGEKWYDSPPTRPCFRLKVCERIEPATFGNVEIPSLAARSLTRYVVRRFGEFAANA
jgi:1-acyl-sn-glycerol-3-phosphate acyltransferase